MDDAGSVVFQLLVLEQEEKRSVSAHGVLR